MKNYVYSCVVVAFLVWASDALAVTIPPHSGPIVTANGTTIWTGDTEVELTEGQGEDTIVGDNAVVTLFGSTEVNVNGDNNQVYLRGPGWANVDGSENGVWLSAGGSVAVVSGHPNHVSHGNTEGSTLASTEDHPDNGVAGDTSRTTVNGKIVSRRDN